MRKVVMLGLALAGLLTAFVLSGGGGAVTGVLPVTVVSESASTFTLGWTPPAGIAGYEFKVDGARVSSTWDASRSTARFSKVAGGVPHTYQVVAVAEAQAGSVTFPAPSSTAPVWPNTSEPAYVPTRIAATASEFFSVMGSLKAGDIVEVKPMTLPGEVVFGQKLSAPADIHFDDGVLFTGTAAGTSLPAVWIHGSNLRLYGGDVTGLGNDCVRVGASSTDTSGPTNVRWWGAKLHDCGGNGFSTQASNYPNANLDIAMDVTGWARTLTVDPHAIKGTGLHGAYLGGGNAPTTGRFVFVVHDDAYGAGIEAGANLQHAVIYERASNLTWSGTPGYAGNAFQPWGGHNDDVTVRDLEALNVTGHAVFDESLTGGSITVEYARGSGVGLTPLYEASPYVSCLDCQ